MSDNLVKRLREGDEFTFDPTQSKVNIGPINDPIYIGEEKPFGASVVQDIEAQLAEQIEWVKRLADDLNAAEAKLARAVEAAEKAVGHIERIPPKIATARVELCDALAELKGQDDGNDT